VIFSVGIIAVGYGLMKLTTPTEDQLYKKLSPELQKKYKIAKDNRLEKDVETEKMIKENALSDRPVWDVYPRKKA